MLTDRFRYAEAIGRVPTSLLALCAVSLFWTQLACGVTVMEKGRSGDNFVVDRRQKLAIDPDQDGLTLADLQDQLMSSAMRRQRRQAPMVESDGLPEGLFQNTLVADRHAYAAVHWPDRNTSNIYIWTWTLAEGKVVSSAFYKSSNTGESFSKEDFHSDTLLDYYQVSPVNPLKFVLVDVSNKMLFVSGDGLASYREQRLQFSPDRLTFAPKLASGTASSDHVLAYDQTQQALYLSVDFCRSWTPVRVRRGRVVRYEWASPNPRTSARYPRGVFFFEAEQRHGVVRLYEGSLTGDARKVSIKELDDELGEIESDSLAVATDYIFVRKSDATSSLYVSYQYQSFKKCIFPGTLPKHEYLIVDMSEGKVFIAVYHAWNVTNLYSSDATGTVYNLALENVLGSSRRHWNTPSAFVDVYPVTSVNGVYLANQVFVDQHGRRQARTLITFDKGAQWQLIKAPHNLCLPYIIWGLCSLHVHIFYFSGLTSGVVSSPSAVGLLIAQGNVGRQLSSRSSIFVSSDAGLTWTKIMEDSHSFTLGDHGGFFLSAFQRWGILARLLPSSAIVYSCDQGRSLVQYQFAPGPEYIHGLLTDKLGTSRLAIMLSTPVRSKGDLRITLVNVSTLLNESCINEDFENWTLLSSSSVQQQLGRSCVLGETLTYERRKVDACCFNGKKFERVVYRKPCPCGQEDFECDYGYVRNSIVLPCRPQPGVRLPAEPADCTGTYNQSIGYRQVPGNRCIGGQFAAYLPVVANCSKRTMPASKPTSRPMPTNSGKPLPVSHLSNAGKPTSSGSNAKIYVPIIVIVLLALAAALAGVWWWRRRYGELAVTYGKMDSLALNEQTASSQPEHKENCYT